MLQVIDRQLDFKSPDKYQACSKAVVKGLLVMCHGLAGGMLAKLIENNELLGEEMLDVNTDSFEWQVWKPLRYVKEVAARSLGLDDEMEDENNIEPKCEKTENLVSFCVNIMKIMEKIKESEHGSTMVTIQPQIGELTLLLHPLLWATAATFKKENHEKAKDFDWSQVPAESIPMMENTKSSYNCSRVVLINLDGYESEFNLEFARNFKKHLLYVSFPKEEAKLNDLKQVYSQRFFKKLMFKYSQSLYESYGPTSQVSEEYKQLTKLERLTSNPEEYHCFVEGLYDHKNDKSQEDFNQNLYIFPIRMALLQEKFPEVMEAREDIENHESYFVRFIIKDFLLNQIREFNPTEVMISYSGRIHLEDSHWVELVQELTKIANYKLLLFPNFTSAMVTPEMLDIEDAEGEEA